MWAARARRLAETRESIKPCENVVGCPDHNARTDDCSGELLRDVREKRNLLVPHDCENCLPNSWLFYIDDGFNPSSARALFGRNHCVYARDQE